MSDSGRFGGNQSGDSVERPVAWKEGMHLHPQHFQQQDRALADAANYRVDALDHFPWGVIDLEIDPTRLAEGVVHINRLEAILESGAILSASSGGTVLDRNLRDVEAAPAADLDANLDPLANRHKKGTRFPVFLGLRNPTDGTNSWSREASEGDGPTDRDRTHRFEITHNEIVDFTHAKPTARRIDVLRANARLLFEGEAERENCEAIQIALVEATGDPQQAYRLVPDYAPPLLSLRGAPGLFESLENLIKRMRRRVPELAKRTAQIDAGDIKWLFVRHTLVRSIAVLEHLLSASRARPFEIYTALTDAAASLVSLEVLEVPQLPTYDPHSLGSCFSSLIATIDDELEKSWTDRFRKVPLEFQEDAANAPDRIYAAPLTTDLQKSGNSYYLAIAVPTDVEIELVDEIVATRKAGLPDEVPLLVEESMTGIAFKNRDAPPVEISGPKGFVYYELDPNHDADSIDHWRQVMRPNGSFAVHLGALEKVEVVLYVVFPKEK